MRLTLELRYYATSIGILQELVHKNVFPSEWDALLALSDLLKVIDVSNDIIGPNV